MDIKKIIMLELLGVTGTFGIQWGHALFMDSSQDYEAIKTRLEECSKHYHRLEEEFSNFQALKNSLGLFLDQGITMLQDKYWKWILDNWNTLDPINNRHLIAELEAIERKIFEFQQQKRQLLGAVDQMDFNAMTDFMLEFSQQYRGLRGQYECLNADMEEIANSPAIRFLNVTDIEELLEMLENCVARFNLLPQP
ncbi:MAG: hypothetical protein LBB05_04365 [Puniceicoccales bacterium]|jgi:DNA repair exonuclease SbcCD ATPase subunit|nr:hypothetical protein [Puniceicoccales bacterium]